ncbi:epimerase, partial [Gammaproteobacteria bacterium SCGC AG-212-F23]
MNDLTMSIKKLRGPILILGASGFVGANLFRMLKNVRDDVYGTATRLPAWRLPEFSLLQTDLSSESHTKKLLDEIQPQTIFDCATYGGYSFENNAERIYRTNLFSKVQLIHALMQRNIHCYVHAGSSSEYGYDAAAPDEDRMTKPNSHYAVTKSAIANLLYYSGKHQAFPCANLRLYAVYGPWEDRARLIPTLVAQGLEKRLPPFVKAETSRDFVFVDDVCKAFIQTANHLTADHYGESFNIGTGKKTSIRELADIARDLYHVNEQPKFASMDSRSWDTDEWYANPEKAKKILHWSAETKLAEGLAKTTAWLNSLENKDQYLHVSKQNTRDTQYSISAIIACYKDAQAIPIMTERLVNVFEKCNIDYEIILVNDGSPDNSEEVIRDLSANNPHVMGITHARNFGSQSAFRSGMQIASKNACVLLDGDLQDPPELIEEFIQKWREGYDVVYGIRVKREAPFLMQMAYKLFYRLFDWFSSVPIPHDAGDFSLMSKRVVSWLLTCNEKDLFLRGLRAYVGFKQTGVEYVRPERMFGVTTNNFFKNVGWAKKGIFSFSKTPLNMVTAAGVVLTAFTVLLAIYQIGMHILFPQSAPKGITTLMLLIMFFGSFTIFSISLLGEYIAKIFEEVKARPHYIRKHLIRNG